MQPTLKHYLSSNEGDLDSLGLNVKRAIIDEDFPLHTHDFSETFIIVSGTVTHVLGEWEYPVKRGDVYAIKGNIPHGFKNVKALDIINLMYKPSFFSRSVPEIRSLPGFVPFFLLEPEIRKRGESTCALALGDQSLQYVTMMADMIMQEQEKAEQSSQSVIKMTFGALAGYLASQYDVRMEVHGSISSLTHAVAYMEQNLSSSIQLADIAQSVYLSPRQLERLFETHYGTSPMKYLRDMRLKHALSLLTGTDCSVSDAAHESGFDDVSYFIRVFRQAYGFTPNMVNKVYVKGTAEK
ncbi:MAG TPA: AraC family transcriptional regulator [Firmicutes bacterium]|nr:AraC family transcriptional regulator [Bacillota bacterium]